MKVRDYIKFLMDFNMDAEIVVSTGDTFDDYTEMDISWGGPNSSDGNSKIDAKYIYINGDFELDYQNGYVNFTKIYDESNDKIFRIDYLQ